MAARSIIDGSVAVETLAFDVDCVIVGTGAGGAVAGKELAELGYSVLFLEEGRHHPSSTHRDTPVDAVKRMYRNQGMTLAVGDPFFTIPMGCGVGGTTLINSGTALRPADAVLQRWQSEFGLEGVSPDQLAVHYDAVERVLGVAPARDDVMSFGNKKVAEIFRANTLEATPLPRNAPQCAGCGLCCYGCTSGAKQSVEQNYIPQALALGASVVTSCRVEKIQTISIDRYLEAHRVVGVLLDARGQRTQYHVEVSAKVVILAAGSVHTPVLIKRNQLSRSPHVGKNLTVHPASKVHAEFEDDVRGWQGIPQGYYSHALEKQGVLFEGVFIPPDLISAMLPLATPDVHGFMKNYRHIVTFGFMIEDSTTGVIADWPLVGPVVRYQLTQEDANRVRLGTAFLARLFLKNGARRVVPMVRSSLHELKSLNDVEAFEAMPIKPSQLELAAFHLLGTARMAASIEQGVVDEDGLIFGASNIFVADGSVVPTALGANPQLTIMALARRLAHHIHGLVSL